MKEKEGQIKTKNKKKVKDKLDRFRNKSIKISNQNVLDLNNIEETNSINALKKEDSEDDIDLDLLDEKYAELKLVERRLSRLVSKLGVATKYKRSIYNIVNDLINYTLGYDSAIETLKYETYNTIVNLDGLKFISTVRTKILELKYLSSILNASGLSVFHDEIMLLHIQKLFGQAGMPSDFKSQLETIKKNRLEEPMVFEKKKLHSLKDR